MECGRALLPGLAGGQAGGMRWCVPSPCSLARQQVAGFTSAILPLSFPSHRPLKVERGRKKSDLIPERRMEKKKGESAVACCDRGEGEKGSTVGAPIPGKGRDLPSTAVVPTSS